MARALIRLLIVWLPIVLVAACTATPEPAAAPSTSRGTSLTTARHNGFLRFPPADAGVLISSSIAEPATKRTYPQDSSSHIVLQLRDCRMLWPGRVAYDLSWTPPPDFAMPATIAMTLTRSVPGSSTSTSISATLSGGGAFTVVVDPEGGNQTPPPPSESTRTRTWAGDRTAFVHQLGGSCSVEVRSDHPTDVTNTSHGIRVDIVRPGVTAPDGTVEALFPLIDPANPQDPLLPLLALYRNPTWPTIDRLWIAPSTSMASITITEQATCRTVTTTYGNETDVRQPSPDHATMIQRRGCPGDGSPGAVQDADTVIRVEDAVWDVRVIGPASVAGDLIAKMTALPFADASASAGTAAGGFDATAYLDAWYHDHPDNLELGRAAWQGGQVGLTLRHSEVGQHPTLDVDVVAATSTGPLNAGGSGMDCKDFATKTTANMQRGYVAIVATDRVSKAQYVDGGQTHDVTLAVSKQPGYRSGFIADPPLPTRPNYGLNIQLKFFDATGAEVSCVQ